MAQTEVLFTTLYQCITTIDN